MKLLFPDNLHLYVHIDFGNPKLDRIISALIKQEETAMATAAEVKAAADATLSAIHDNGDKDDAIITLVTANTQVISDLRTQLAEAIAGGDPVALQAVLDALTAAQTSALANSSKVLAAINANTSPS
jgi:hypothetical protein